MERFAHHTIQQAEHVHAAISWKVQKIGEHMDEVHRLNQIILDSLPHWAMLINVKARTVLAANKLAIEGGAKIDCQCWDDFGHRQFILEEYKEIIKKEPERKGTIK